jgi:cytochrome P450
MLTMDTSIALSASVWLLAIWVCITLRLIPRPIPGIPYNRLSSVSPWGELLVLGIYNFCTGEVFSWLYLQCVLHKSPIVQLFIPSFSNTRPVVVIADLREIEDIVTKRVHEIDRAPLMHDFFGFLVPDATIGMPTGERFKKQRRLWNTILSPSFLREVAAPTIHQAVLNLADIWQQKTDLAGDDAFEFGEDIKMATLDAIWSMAVGSNLGLLDANRKRLSYRPINRSHGKVTFRGMERPPFYRALCTLLTCLDWVMQGISPRMYRWIFRHMPAFLYAEKLKNEHLNEEISAARKRQRNSEISKITCALDQVLWKDATLADGSGEESSDAALRDELLELLITGHETTASSICWALKYLTDNPDIQSSLRNSIYTAFPNASSTASPSALELTETSLPYLDAVITEVMRCSRTGPVSFRHAVTECRILGHCVPAGTPIILVTAGPFDSLFNRLNILESKRSFTSQTTYICKGDRDFNLDIPIDQFVPGRWLQDGKFDENAGLSLPFSSGPRGCFGKKIALLEMRLMLALLVIRFEFPRLGVRLSRYMAKDGLTRRPTCCYVRPVSHQHIKA